MHSYDGSDLRKNYSYSDIIVTWTEDLNSNGQILIKAHKNTHPFFKEDFYASKNIIIAAFYSETFALWPLCKYLQDEDKYPKVTERAREITRMKYLGFLTG